MSSNRFNLDRALDALRSETPANDVRERARQALLKPSTRSFRPRLLVVGAVGAGIVTLLWPRPGAGTAWAQVASETRNQPRMYSAVFKPGSTLPYSRTWVDGDRFRMQFEFPGGPDRRLDITYVAANDGKRYIRYMAGPARLKNGEARSAFVQSADTKQAHGYRVGLGFFGASSNLIDDVIRSEDWKVQEHKEGVKTPEGVRNSYRIMRTVVGKEQTYTYRYLIYVNPDTKLISQAITLDEKRGAVCITKFTYPPSLPDSVFRYHPPAGVPVRDLDRDTALLESRLVKGLGVRKVAGKTITLRAVLHDGTGALWVLWTGGAPAGNLGYPVTVKERPKARVAGLKAFTVTPDIRSKPAPSIGERLGGMSVIMPTEKPIDWVTVTVPVLDETGKKKLGSATFDHVPVFRIDSIYDFGKPLGLH